MRAEEFKHIRERLRLTQQELAEAFGLAGKNVVSNIETGFRNPSGTLVAVLKLLATLPEKDAHALVRKLRAQARPNGNSNGSGR